MPQALEVTLPGGLWHAEQRWREAAVRPLSGHDEAFLRSHGPDLSPPARATALLARVVAAIGPLAPPGAEVLRDLRVGDREALLWAVRRATFGDRLDLVVECGGCGAKLDAALGLGGLGAEPAGRWAVAYTDELEGRQVRYRAPTGGDQEAVAGIADPDEATQRLTERVVVSVDGRPPTPADLASLVEPLSDRLAGNDPRAETLLDVACPDCAARTSTLVDAGAVLAEEAVQGARWLDEEVHTLAWHYHWGEDAILSLPTARRRRYLDLIAAQLSGAAG